MAAPFLDLNWWLNFGEQICQTYLVKSKDADIGFVHQYEY